MSGTKGSAKGDPIFVEENEICELPGCCGVFVMYNLGNPEDDVFYEELAGSYTKEVLKRSDQLKAGVDSLKDLTARAVNVVFTDANDLAVDYENGEFWASCFRKMGWKVKRIQLNRSPTTGNGLRLWVATKK